MTVNIAQIESLYDANVVDSNGDRVGSVGQVYIDDQNGQPSWVTVKTGLFGTNETFIPLQEARVSGDQIAVPYTKDFIKDAPNIDGEKHLDDADQDNLFTYYNVGSRSPAGTDRGASGTDAEYRDTGVGTTANDRTGFDAGRNADPGGPGTGTAEGAADRTGTERGTSRFRIRKHTVTEHQTITVPVEREVAELVDDSAVDNSAVVDSARSGRHVDNTDPSAR